MPNNYIAITTGPIYKTLDSVRKTRELWAASYTFSYLSRTLIERIMAIDLDAVLMPSYRANTPIGIGLYPDRIFLKNSGKLDDVILKDVIDESISEIAGWMHPDKEKAHVFLKNYFRIWCKAYDPGNENPIFIGNKILDTAELMSKWQTEEQQNVLLSFFRNINTIKAGEGKWLHKHFAMQDGRGEVRFESLIEIATRPLRKGNEKLYGELVKEHCYDTVDKDDDNDFISNLKQQLPLTDGGSPFKNYHKYICIVKADGDRVGSYVSAVASDHEKTLKDVSDGLAEWGASSAEVIQQYAGVPIYAGGDDLLFFAPVVGNNGATILDLLDNINNIFLDQVKKWPVLHDDDGLISPSLSFGVSVTYYKYPLNEAVKKADTLLHTAKETRNARAISLLKHSGTKFDITLSNTPDDGVRKSFSELDKFFTDDSTFISSIIHHFREHEGIYKAIANDREKVALFLSNNFDSKQHTNLVTHIAALYNEIYSANNIAGDAPSASFEVTPRAIHQTHSALRLLKFLNGQDDDK